MKRDFPDSQPPSMNYELKDVVGFVNMPYHFNCYLNVLL